MSQQVRVHSLRDLGRRAVSSAVASLSDWVIPNKIARIRDKRAWINWVDSLSPDSLNDLTNASRERKQQLFKANVRRVEIETHAKCNRVCSFCPNSFMDRRTNNVRTDSAMLDRVFQDLGSIDYAAQITVARYSEPLADKEYLYERLERARALCPHAILTLTTNTDYLKPTVLDRLIEAGLNVAYLSLYLRDHERWTLDLARTYTDRLVERLGITVQQVRETPSQIHGTFRYKNLRLYSTCTNFDTWGTDRAGTVVHPVRTATRIGPCRDPFDTFVIDYTGAVVPCCNIRSDLPQHRDYVVGNLSQPGTSIFDIYAGQLAGWRRSMVGFGKKDAPCTTCRHRELPANLITPVGNRLTKRLTELELLQLAGR